jgi:CheY-like chemotaxis protein
MHVNVSTYQLSDPSIVDDVRRCIEGTGIGSGRLIIEITESAALAGTRELEAVHRLKRLGVRVALDDFGTGYSSLSHLARLPIDEIKIDKSFTDDIPGGPNGLLLAGVLALAGQIGMATVIEGVEYPEQAEALIAMGARLAQGFLYGQPLSSADFGGRLVLQRRASEPADVMHPVQTVLIVDDDDLMSAMLARHLHRLGYSTVRASCADHALALARALPPAFAVIDVEMPDVDGWTLIERIQADEIVDDLRIVVVSGAATTVHADRAARAGLRFIDKSDRRLRSRLKESIELLDQERLELHR